MLITEEIDATNQEKEILEGLTFYWKRNGVRVIQIHFWHKFHRTEGNLPREDAYMFMYNQSMDVTRIFFLFCFLEK